VIRIIPQDGRDELRALAYGNSPAEYLDKVWDMREQENPRAGKASDGWPYKAASAPSNVTKLPKRRP